MKLPKVKTAGSLALLFAFSGCAYFRPEPSRLGGQVTQEGSVTTNQDETKSDQGGLLGFLEQSAYNVFKGYQEAGR